MKEINTTIQIYTPEEKLPEHNKPFVAMRKAYSWSDDDGSVFNVPEELHFGIVNKNGMYCIDFEASQLNLDEELFRTEFKWWYELPKFEE